jgi:hypothetical protein
VRKFNEPTARNLLRKPLVLGVPLPGLLLLSVGVLALSVLLGKSRTGGITSAGAGAVGYALLRVFARFAKGGWEESLLFPIEKIAKVKNPNGTLEIQTEDLEVFSPDTLEVFSPDTLEVFSPDTLEETDMIRTKTYWMDRIKELKTGQRLTLACEVTQAGASLREISTQGRYSLKSPLDLTAMTWGLISPQAYLYSLYQLPVSSDPLWLFGILSKLKPGFKVFVSLQGLDFLQMKQRIEHSRRSNARGEAQLSDIDSEVTFEEASRVLMGLSRGEEAVAELSLVIASDVPLDLDPSLFCKEKDVALTALSILGIRRRFHRSHYVRAVTATDLIPNILDPQEPGSAILTTPRGNPLYFSPQDSRLEALHWLVVGTTGSGKSFFTALVLRRMIQAGTPMSVLFVDHNRSFRRLVLNGGEIYVEPSDLEQARIVFGSLLERLNHPGALVGIELSEMNQDEKKTVAFELLSKIEAFLRARDTTHPVYIVLDECWNFMRDQPVMVQRAFREFRKLNGAAIAITQSLSDFLTDSSGQSIFQNAPIRVLLRQGEDLGRYQGVLGLNPIELEKTRYLQQRKGVFSECLIKTPFLSRFGRLYPTEEEHSLLRTDNIRAEMIEVAKAAKAVKLTQTISPKERTEKCDPISSV